MPVGKLMSLLYGSVAWIHWGLARTRLAEAWLGPGSPRPGSDQARRGLAQTWLAEAWLVYARLFARTCHYQMLSVYEFTTVWIITWLWGGGMVMSRHSHDRCKANGWDRCLITCSNSSQLLHNRTADKRTKSALAACNWSANVCAHKRTVRLSLVHISETTILSLFILLLCCVWNRTVKFACSNAVWAKVHLAEANSSRIP